MTTACLFLLITLAVGTLLSRVFQDGLEEVLARVPSARIGEGRTGWVRVRGHVRAQDKPLTLPWSGRAAVYYEVDVTADRVGGEGDSLRSRHVGGVDFEIDDGSGRALVRIPRRGSGRVPARTVDSKPEILTALGPSRRFAFDPESSRDRPVELQRLLDGLEVYDVSGGASVHAVERIIAPGDEVIVAGYATLEVDPRGSSINFRSPPTLIVFAATDEHPLVLANPRGLETRWRD